MAWPHPSHGDPSEGWQGLGETVDLVLWLPVCDSAFQVNKFEKAKPDRVFVCAIRQVRRAFVNI